MLVPQASRLAQADAINDACMVELVRNDGIIGRETRLKEASIAVESTWVQDGVVHLVEVGNFPLQGLVDVLSAADEAHG